VSIHPENRKFYGHKWRTVTRPAILRRAGGVFDSDGTYLGFACCERCGRPDALLSIWQASELDIAHLTGDVANSADDELAALCKPCHRAVDYRIWSLLFTTWLYRDRQRKIDAADAERPILQIVRAS
jgi:hypothetical protein